MLGICIQRHITGSVFIQHLQRSLSPQLETKLLSPNQKKSISLFADLWSVFLTQRQSQQKINPKATPAQWALAIERSNIEIIRRDNGDS